MVNKCMSIKIIFCCGTQKRAGFVGGVSADHPKNTGLVQEVKNCLKTGAFEGIDSMKIT
jgi:hypothetical protein